MKQVVRILLFVAFLEVGRITLALPNGIDTRIVGGNEVTPHSIPYQVLIVKHLHDLVLKSGGSLISPEWVLTAAHCLAGYNGTNIWLALGVHDVNATEPSRVDQQPLQIIVHENWTFFIQANDIALVRLPIAAVLNDNIQIINLPRESDINSTFYRLTGTVSGWGLLGYKSPVTNNVLRSVDLRVISNDLCANLYNGRPRILDTHLCTSSSARKDACTSDSGSPLTIGEGDNLKQIGIVAFGKNCAVWPGGFTRVTSYLHWISNHTGIEIRP